MNINSKYKMIFSWQASLGGYIDPRYTYFFIFGTFLPLSFYPWCIVTCCLCLYLGAKDRYWSESTICENVINWILSWLLSEPETFKGFLDFFRSNMIMLLFNTSRKGIWRSLLRCISTGRNMAVFLLYFIFIVSDSLF